MGRHTLNGYVVADDDQELYDYFQIPAFSPGVIRRALSDDTDEEIILEVNSPGGLVSAGQEMYTLLASHPGRVTAEVQSIAASSASVMICGCSRVLVSPVAQIMIHPPYTYTEGDAADMEEAAQMLSAITEGALNVYERKCAGKTSREELSRMIAASTWLDARRAVEVGLADGVLYDDAEDKGVYNSLGAGLRGMFGHGSMPTAAQLRARYEAEHSSPAPALSEDWRNSARLTLARAEHKYF